MYERTDEFSIVGNHLFFLYRKIAEYNKTGLTDGVVLFKIIIIERE